MVKLWRYILTGAIVQTAIAGPASDPCGNQVSMWIELKDQQPFHLGQHLVPGGYFHVNESCNPQECCEFEAVFSLWSVKANGQLALLIQQNAIYVSPQYPLDPAPYGHIHVGIGDVHLPSGLVEIVFTAEWPDHVVLVDNFYTVRSPDLNGDHVVNGTDLNILLGAWGKAGFPDINNDGSVDIDDLLIVLEKWGAA